MLLFQNPILRRELLDRLRSPKTLAAILAVAFLSSMLVVMRWPTDAAIDLVSQGALQVFRPVAFALATAVMMLIPAFPATAIVTERRRGTLTLLLNSPTTPIEIYLGKLCGNVLLAIVIFSVSLPAIVACYAMGGISLKNHVGPLILVLLGMAIQYSAVGLWISIRSNTADGSLRWTYAAVLALAILSIGPTVFVGKLSGVQAIVAHWMTAISPVSALQQITGSQAQANEIGIATGWQEFLIASAVITVALAVSTLFSLDPILLDRARPTGTVVHAASVGAWSRRMTYLIDPNRRKPGIPWWLNPIMVKEFRTRKFGRLHWLLRLVAGCAVVSLMMTVVAATGTVSWGVERIAATMVILQMALLLLLGPSLGAGLIASEVESGGWQLLRASPISPIRVVVGKLMSTIWTLLLMLLATLPGYVVMSYIQPQIGGQVSNVVLSLIVAIIMVTMISACVSAFSKTTAVATATSYAILLTLFAGTLLIWVARGRPFGPFVVERALMLNPTAAALAEMKTPGFEQYSLTPGCWYVGGAISLACLVILSVRTWRLTRPD
jgi:ABC-type transport system involved in multi-copper enzyme maturation permease subunit